MHTAYSAAHSFKMGYEFTHTDEQLALDYKLRDGQSDLEAYLAANATYARETKEQERERLRLALSTAEAYLLQNTLTEEQRRTMGLIVTGLRESLAGSALPEEPSGIDAFLEKNATYARETKEQEKERLELALATAEAYLLQNTLTEDQRRNMGLIVNGLQAGIDTIPGAAAEVVPTIREQLEAAFEARIPTTGIKKWASEAQDAVTSVTAFLQDNFGTMVEFGISFYETLVTAQQDAAKAQIGILEKQIAAEKKLQEKQTRTVQSQYDQRSQSLADRYAWGLIAYGDYIAAQQALDEEKTVSEEAAASRLEALEKQKADIQNAVSKTAFENTKRQSIAQALILGAQAVLQGYATLGPIGGTIAAAVIAGVTAAQIGIISSQQYTPTAALAAGGIAYRPTAAIIGEGGEPEMVLPLSKAESMGFTGGSTRESTLVININAPTYTGRDLTDSVYEGISQAQRTGRLPAWGGS